VQRWKSSRNHQKGANSDHGKIFNKRWGFSPASTGDLYYRSSWPEDKVFLSSPQASGPAELLKICQELSKLKENLEISQNSEKSRKINRAEQAERSFQSAFSNQLLVSQETILRLFVF
jgi:hypothetical protein